MAAGPLPSAAPLGSARVLWQLLLGERGWEQEWAWGQDVDWGEDRTERGIGKEVEIWVEIVKDGCKGRGERQGWK